MGKTAINISLLSLTLLVSTVLYGFINMDLGEGSAGIAFLIFFFPSVIVVLINTLSVYISNFFLNENKARWIGIFLTPFFLLVFSFYNSKEELLFQVFILWAILTVLVNFITLKSKE